MEVLSTVSAIFALLLVGYGAKRIGILKSGDASVINSVVTNLAAPAFIFMALYGKPLTADMVKAPIVVVACSLIVMGLAYMTSRAMGLDRRTTGGLMLAAAFGNTGFLGYPVSIAAFPGRQEGLATAVMIDQFSMGLPLVSVGVVVASTFAATEFTRGQALEFLRTPMFPATVLALILRNAPLPAPLIAALTFLSGATVPLAMISVGLSLSRSSISSATRPVVAVTLLKMVVLPAVAYLGLRAAGVTGIVRDAAVMEASMPTAIMAGVIAGRYGANGAFVSGATFVMTLLSILTIPLILLLLR